MPVAICNGNSFQFISTTKTKLFRISTQIFDSIRFYLLLFCFVVNVHFFVYLCFNNPFFFFGRFYGDTANIFVDSRKKENKIKIIKKVKRSEKDTSKIFRLKRETQIKRFFFRLVFIAKWNGIFRNKWVQHIKSVNLKMWFGSFSGEKLENCLRFSIPWYLAAQMLFN